MKIKHKLVMFIVFSSKNAIFAIENRIEAILSEYDLGLLDELVEIGMEMRKEMPERAEILYKIDYFENWIKKKEAYDNWNSSASEEEKTKFCNYVNSYFFDNNLSSEHIREYVVKQLDSDKCTEYQKEWVLNWFDQDRDKGKELFYYIWCVREYNCLKRGWYV